MLRIPGTMASARLVAFLDELAPRMEEFQPRAEALILRVPGEGQPALTAESEAAVLVHVADGLVPVVQGWLRAVDDLATTERAWGPADRAREAAHRFNEQTEKFLHVWERLLLVQPATEPMRRLLGLMHQGCYELYLSGPQSLWHSCRDIVAGEQEARLVFEPEAPALALATQELRRAAR